MEEKSLNLGKKIIYGFGDLGGNFLAIFIGAYIMLYLTNTIGLNAGVIGTLMLVARIFDGITDVMFGALMDHTHTRFGKVRPWMFVSSFLCAAGIIAIYAMPEGLGETAQYAYFFIVYVLTNAFFYTANNISYSALSALITKNAEERVQLGTARYVCATIAIMIILSASVPLVEHFGGGTKGWRTVAVIYAAVFLIMNLICVIFLKEIPEDDYGNKGEKKSDGSKQGEVSFIQTIKILFTSKYFLLILGVYMSFYWWTGAVSSLSAYYMTYVAGDITMQGIFSTAQNLCCAGGLMLMPFIVKKFGVHQSVTRLVAIGIIPAILFAAVAFSGKIALLIPAIALVGLFCAPITGTLNATVADIGTYLHLTKGVHVEGSLFSCSSIGIKVGSGVGGAMVGWLLALSGFDGMAAAQPDSAIFAMKAAFGILPIIVFILVFLCFKGLNMEAAIEKAKAEKL